MATHSSILAWEIPWTEEPGRLQSRSQSRTQLRRQGPLTPFTSGGVANYRCSVWGPLWRYLVLLVVWPPWRGGWKISLALCPIPLLYALIYLPISQRIWTVTPALKDIVFPSNSHQRTTVQHEEVDPARTGYISHYVTELLVSTKPPGCGLVFYIIFRQQVFLAFLHIPGMSKHCWPSKISENTLELWTFYLTFRFIHCIKIKGNINRRWSEEVKRKHKCGSEGCLDHCESWTHDLVDEAEQNQRHTALLRSQGTWCGNTEQVSQGTVNSLTWPGGQHGDKPALIRKTREPWQEFMMT